MRREKTHTKWWNDSTPWRLTYSESYRGAREIECQHLMSLDEQL